MNNKTIGDLRHEAVVEQSLRQIAEAMKDLAETQRTLSAKISVGVLGERAETDVDAELLPCPCCGGKAHVHGSASDPAMGYVACDDTLGCGLTNGFNTITNAVARWNRRGGAA